MANHYVVFPLLQLNTAPQKLHLALKLCFACILQLCEVVPHQRFHGPTNLQTRLTVLATDINNIT